MLMKMEYVKCSPQGGVKVFNYHSVFGIPLPLPLPYSYFTWAPFFCSKQSLNLDLPEVASISGKCKIFFN